MRVRLERECGLQFELYALQEMEMKEISSVAVLGAGTMGANIALSFAAHGIQVHLMDVSPKQLERGISTIRENAVQLLEHGLLTEEVDHIIARVTFVAALETAIAGVGLVLEVVPEIIEIKEQLFRKLESMTGPEVILASNTSTFVPSRLCSAFAHAETAGRFVVLHYWNPAHLIPLVEVVPHTKTAPTILRTVKAMLDCCDKQAVVLQKEIPGFLGNRLAFALQREAMRMVADGVAMPDDIDTVVRGGFGRRMPVTGIFGTADFGGLDVYLAVCDQVFPSLCNDSAAPDILKRLVNSGRLGMKTREGWSKYSECDIAEWQRRVTDDLVHFARSDLRREQGTPHPRSDR